MDLCILGIPLTIGEREATGLGDGKERLSCGRLGISAEARIAVTVSLFSPRRTGNPGEGNSFLSFKLRVGALAVAHPLPFREANFSNSKLVSRCVTDQTKTSLPSVVEPKNETNAKGTQ